MRKKISPKKQAKILRKFAKSIERGEIELVHVDTVPIGMSSSGLLCEKIVIECRAIQ